MYRFVRYVLAFLATNAPPHRPLHHAKPITTMSVNPAVKHSVHHPAGASSAAAAARLERVKHAQGQNQTRAQAAAVHPSAAAAAPKSSESQSSIRANRAAQASK